MRYRAVRDKITPIWNEICGLNRFFSPHGPFIFFNLALSETALTFLRRSVECWKMRKFISGILGDLYNILGLWCELVNICDVGAYSIKMKSKLLIHSRRINPFGVNIYRMRRARLNNFLSENWFSTRAYHLCIIAW